LPQHCTEINTAAHAVVCSFTGFIVRYVVFVFSSYLMWYCETKTYSKLTVLKTCLQ